MTLIEEALRRVDTITFDCYGTLVDWRAGLGQCFLKLFGDAAQDRVGELFEDYVQTEAEIEAGEYRPYRQVLAATAGRLAKRFGFDFPAERVELLGEMLPEWPLFADTNEALRKLTSRFRLGVLSNIDKDLFAGTARHFELAFDFVITAEDVRAYKPAHAHFEELLSQYAEKDRVLHVAQSLYHDGVPAGQLGIAYVWINRYKDNNETNACPLATYPDLRSLAAAACDDEQ